MSAVTAGVKPWASSVAAVTGPMQANPVLAKSSGSFPRSEKKFVTVEELVNVMRSIFASEIFSFIVSSSCFE